MHELALMENVLNIVQESARERGIRHVHRVKLVVGEFSMAVPESLHFAFSVFSEEELFAGATLELEMQPLTCQCSHCGQDYAPPDHYDLRCPHCASQAIEIRSGRELRLEYYEGE